MTLSNKTILALKYLSGHYKRYIFLILAVSFSFAIITTVTSLSAGMYKNVYNAAEQHYGGQLFVLGFDKKYGNIGLVQEDDVISHAVEALKKKPDHVVRRTLFFADGILFFDGNSSRQKSVYGVDWNVEYKEFKQLDYSAGGCNNLSGTNGILISEPVSKKLHVRVGDDLILKVRTKTGQNNTGTFIVRGIFRDNSIFGYYTCYIDRRHLNNLLRFKEDAYSSMGLYYNSLETAEKQSVPLYNELKKKLPMAPVMSNKEDFSFQLDQHWKGIRYFVMTIQLYVSQVTDMLTAMKLISYFLYVMISLIVLVSISVTYRLIIHERQAEIGTMRAIGLLRKEILTILLIEAFFVFLISLLFGGILSLLTLRIISFFSFSLIPGFDIFMYRGKLLPSFTMKDIGTNILMLAVIIFPSLVTSFSRVGKMNLATILSGHNY